MIDWSVEKTKIHFESPVAERRRRIMERLRTKRAAQLGWRKPVAPAWSFVGLAPVETTSIDPDNRIRLVYEGNEIGHLSLRELEGADFTGFDLGLGMASDFVGSEFVRNSLIRVSILLAQLKLGGRQAKIMVNMQHSNLQNEALVLFEQSFRSFGFVKRGSWLELTTAAPEGDALVELKKYLLDYVKAAPMVGRGFLLDTSRLPPSAVLALCNEYQEVAWGITNWARHSAIERDELDVIQRYVGGEHGLEIGAGSGRVTMHLLERFEKLTATDIVPSALREIERQADARSIKEGRVILTVDDIIETKLKKESYDVVMFWENGLGAILDARKRQKALYNMTKLLRAGGRLILGLRNLVSVPVDQLMIAAQTNLVMGIYHTFTADEIRNSMPGNIRLIAEEQGLARPAGGHQIFLIFQKDN